MGNKSRHSRPADIRIYQRASHVVSASRESCAGAKAALLLVALAVAAPSSASGQRLVLTANVSKTEFFEDEPIYLLVRLQNVGADTAWTYFFGLTTPAVTLSVKVGQRAPFEVPLLHIHHVLDSSWRGEPLPPGASILRAIVLQEIIGNGRSIRDHLFYHLAPDPYELHFAFHAHWGLPRTAPLTVTAAPVVFRIRSATAAERDEVRELEHIWRMASDTTRVAGYPRVLGYRTALISWVERRLRMQPDDPFLPFLLYYGVSLGQQILARQILAGELQRFDPDTSEVVSRLRLAVIHRHRHSTAGAHLVQRLAARHPDQLAVLAGQLKGTLAGEMARYHVERKQHEQQPSKQRPR